MKKIFRFLIIFSCVFLLLSCGKDTNKDKNKYEDIIDTELEDKNMPKDDENVDKNIALKINGTILNITWSNNNSVTALKELAKDGLTINMSRYGGFEQVGYLGTTLPSNDERITTSAGDIVLYNSNQIVIFYDSNTWAYTKLGHININKNELTSLLDKETVTIMISVE